MSWRERWAELKRIYGGQKREVRLTAVGWNPGGWTADSGPTASGNHEYYIVVREGEKQPEPVTQPRRVTKRAEAGASDD